LTRDELKQILKQIKEADYKVCENIDLDRLILAMLEHIGDTDAGLRDNLIYTSFCKLAEKEAFSVEQLRTILNTSLDDNHLFYNIGETDTDSIFTRAFSMLMIPAVFRFNRDVKNFLTKVEVLHVKDKVLYYVKKERDFRGIVEGKGWAHAVAHAADALKFLVGNEFLIKDDLIEILDALEPMIKNQDALYNYREDERMLATFIDIIDRELFTGKELISWLNKFKVSEYDKGLKLPNQMYLVNNKKQFLQSSYFYLLKNYKKDISEEIIKEILNILEEF